MLLSRSNINHFTWKQQGFYNTFYNCHFTLLESLAILGGSMKWKLEGKIRFQMPSWVYAGNWRFLFFPYLCHFNIFWVLCLAVFQKWKKKLKFSPILSSKFKKKKRMLPVLGLWPWSMPSVSFTRYGHWDKVKSRVENCSSSFIILFVYEIGDSSYFLPCCRHMSGTVGEREIATLASCKRFKMRPGSEYERALKTEGKYVETALIQLTEINDQFILYSSMVVYNFFL